MSEIVVTKPFWQSTGFWGSIITLAGVIAAKWNFHITDAFSTEAAGLIVSTIGAFIALYGRIKATRPLGMGRQRKTIYSLLLILLLLIPSCILPTTEKGSQKPFGASVTTDHRPIGIVHVADTSHYSPTNPASWLFDPTIDTTTPAGVANFQKRFLQWATDSVVIAKRQNVQALIVWDSDGARYGTYLGSPDIASQINPELVGTLEQYFKIYKNAGIKYGGTIRCDELDPVTKTLVASPDPYKTLLRKMSYAYKYLGWRYFYIDTNMWDWRTSDKLLPPSMFSDIKRKLPGIVIFPEHEIPPGYTWDSNQQIFWTAMQYWETTIPYMAGNIGEWGTPQMVKNSNPYAISAVNVNATDIKANSTKIKTAVSNGDIIMIDCFGAWSPSNQNLQEVLATQ